MQKQVSICLATFNGEKYLKQQLDSIVNQTYKNLHVVVQDDCSSDDTMAILESYKDKLDIEIYQNDKNLGYIKNFESLIQKAKGDYVTICDQDDIWEPNKITNLVKNIKDNSLIYSDSILIDENGNSLNKTLSKKLKNRFIDSSTALNFLYDNCVSAHAVLFKKELLPYIKDFPKIIYFDNYIAATASSLDGVKYIDENLVQYRQHSSNTLGNKTKAKTDMKKRVLSKVEKKDKEVDDIILKIEEMLKIKTLKTDEAKLLNQLYSYYKEYQDRWFNLSIFMFLLKNQDIFFAITKKNSFILSLKKSIGKKLYKAVPIL